MDSTITELPKRGPGRPPKVDTKTETTEAAPVMASVTLFPVRLLKNYRPKGKFTVVKAAPPPLPGVGSEHKLWSGTVVELPRDEAVDLINNTVATKEKVLDSNGRPILDEEGEARTRQRVTKFPLAERMDAIPV
jgi:hypothetical protein